MTSEGLLRSAAFSVPYPFGEPKPSLEKILAPVAGEDPCGEDQTFSGLHEEIREARRADDPTLPQGVWQTALKTSDWAEVRQLCAKGLETKVKSLHLGAWLLEAWTHQYGFRGCAAGLELLLALCERFWDGVYPRIEDGDGEMRAAPFDWMNEKLATPFRRLPVTWPEGGDDTIYCLADWDFVLHVDSVSGQNPEVLQEAVEQGRPTRERLDASVSLTSLEALQAWSGDLWRALAALEKLSDLLDERMGRDAPSLVRFKKTLDDARTLIDGFLTGKGGTPGPAQTRTVGEEAEEAAMSEPETQSEPTEQAEDGANPPAPVPAPAVDMASSGGAGPIASRQEAYQRLSEAADFLAQHEPHSPVPYLIRKAVSWGSKPLDQLLDEQGDFLELLRLLGLRKDG